MKNFKLLDQALKVIEAKKHWLLFLSALVALKTFTPSTFLIMVLAFLFYFIFYPLVTHLEKLTRSAIWSVLIVVLSFCALIFISSSFIFPKLIKQIIDFTVNFPQLMSSVQHEIYPLQQKLNVFQNSFFEFTKISPENIFSSYLAQWGKALSSFFEGLLRSFSSIASFIVHLIVAFIVSIYLLFEKDKLRNGFNSYFKGKTTLNEKKFLLLSYQQVLGYFGGLILLSLLSAAVTWIFLMILGVKFSLLLSLWTGIMEFIPIFGPILAAIPIIFIAWTQSFQLVIPILIFALLKQFILSNLIAPHILGKSTAFSPLQIFLIMLVGGEMFGIWGMIFFIPLASIMQLFWKIYTNKI